MIPQEEQDLEEFVELWQAEEGWFRRAISFLESEREQTRKSGKRKGPQQAQEVANYKSPAQVSSEGVKSLAPTHLC